MSKITVVIKETGHVLATTNDLYIVINPFFLPWLGPSTSYKKQYVAAGHELRRRQRHIFEAARADQDRFARQRPSAVPAVDAQDPLEHLFALIVPFVLANESTLAAFAIRPNGEAPMIVNAQRKALWRAVACVSKGVYSRLYGALPSLMAAVADVCIFPKWRDNPLFRRVGKAARMVDLAVIHAQWIHNKRERPVWLFLIRETYQSLGRGVLDQTSEACVYVKEQLLLRGLHPLT